MRTSRGHRYEPLSCRTNRGSGTIEIGPYGGELTGACGVAPIAASTITAAATRNALFGTPGTSARDVPAASANTGLARWTLRSALLDRVERARPRIIRVVAGVGWGKSTFARALAARMPSAALIECVRAKDREHCEALLLDALAKNHAAHGATSLWEAWTAPGPPALVAFEDVHLLDEHCIDVLRSLLRTLPDGRMLVLSTHYSSLAYLKRLPIDNVKIDQSFIQGIPFVESDAAIVSGIVGLHPSAAAHRHRRRDRKRLAARLARASWMRAGPRFSLRAPDAGGGDVRPLWTADPRI